MIILRRALLLAPLPVLFLLAAAAHAQNDTPPILIAIDPNASIHITMNPQYPEPGDVVHLVVTGGSLVDLEHSTITWTQDNKIISKSVGATSVDVKMGALGQVTQVIAHVESADGLVANDSASITPSHIDLLMDSDSYTPPFYRGRALPSVGTHVHMQALVYFKRPDGSFVPPNSIVYTWRQNGEVVGTVSGKGKASVTLPAPLLYSNDTIEVDAASADDLFHNTASMNLTSIDPSIMLYEDNPLFGIMYHQSMGNTTAIPDSEMTFVAVPYFIQASSPNDPHLNYTWAVNNTPVTAASDHGNEITINADKSTGNAIIDLSIAHTANPFIAPHGTWSVAFKSSSGASGFVPSF